MKNRKRRLIVLVRDAWMAGIALLKLLKKKRAGYRYELVKIGVSNVRSVLLVRQRRHRQR
jgi:hypothetical protein